MTYSFKTLRYYLVMLPVLMQACTSNSEKYYSEADFQKVDKADVHIHIFTQGNNFMDQAMKDNFKVVNIALDASNDMASVRRQFRFCMLQQKNNPSTVEIASAFSMEGWDEPDWLEKNMAWLDSCINNGALAVKIWKNIGMVYRDKKDSLIMIDNPRFDPIFKMLKDRKITVIGHLGEPKNCWLPLEEMTTNNDRSYFRDHPQYHMYQHPDLPSYEDQIRARDNMLEKNPDLTFVGAHLGSLEWSVDALAKTLDKFPNMAVDMAARMGQIFYQTHADREKVREFFIKYQDRLLYATDMGDEGQEKEALRKEMHETWLRDWRFFVTDDTLTCDLVNESYQGIKLPQHVVDKIYYQNAKKWFQAFEENNKPAGVASDR
jgi:predicted TIM-barrel fold metal-dependent hydrolase